MSRFSQHTILYTLAIGLVAFTVMGLFSVSSAFLGTMILLILFNPLFGWLKRVGLGQRGAAGLIVILILVGIVAPLAGIILVIATHAQSVIQTASQLLDRLANAEFPLQYSEALGAFNIKQSAFEWLQSSGAGLTQQLVSVAGNISHGILTMFLMMVLVYYSFIHQDELKKAAYRYWPSHPEALEMIGSQVARVTISVIVSTVLVAVVQSSVLGLTFWALDVPNVLVLSALTFVLSIVPFIGSPVIWASVALMQWLNGDWGSAAIVVGMGVFVSTIDNILRPIFQKRYGELHPVISLVGVVLGVPIFGLLGLFIGPIVLVLMIEVLKMALDAFRSESTSF